MRPRVAVADDDDVLGRQVVAAVGQRRVRHLARPGRSRACRRASSCPPGASSDVRLLADLLERDVPLVHAASRSAITPTIVDGRQLLDGELGDLLLPEVAVGHLARRA